MALGHCGSSDPVLEKTLRRMLASTGFQILQTVTWGGLAKGSVPVAVKRPVDFLAKIMGFGDVVLMLARKPRIETA